MKILKHNDIKLKSFLRRSKVLNDDSIYKKVKGIIFNVKKMEIKHLKNMPNNMIKLILIKKNLN